MPPVVRLAIFLDGWLLMAMMLPAAHDGVMALSGRSALRFLGGFAVVWAGAGLAALALDTIVHQAAAGIPAIGSRSALVGPALFALALGLPGEAPAGAGWQAGARSCSDPLWASTSTKNPAYSDLLYVDALVGPDTVNTMPEATIEAFLHHGTLNPTLGRGTDRARQTLGALTSLGMDLDALSRSLEEQGVDLFVSAFDNVVHAITQKAEQLERVA